ncbi:MAG: HAMP domain-containing sensor histidine kinase [Chloroflexota bacterium]
MNLPIRLRLTLWYLGAMLVFLLLFASFFLGQAYLTLLGQTDNTLVLAAGQAIDDVMLVPEPAFMDEMALRVSMFQIDSDLTVMLVDPDGHQIHRVTHIPPFFRDIIEVDGEVFEFGTEFRNEHGPSLEVLLSEHEELPRVLPLEGFNTISSGGVRWRFFSQPVVEDITDNSNDATAWVQVAQSLDVVDTFVYDMLIQLLLYVPLALLIAGIIGSWLAHRALKPIEQMTTTAQEIGAQDLDLRIDYRGPSDEVGRLAKTMDGMLERLQNAFERERRFTSDAAHELRTPLTALKGNIDVTLSRTRQPDEYETSMKAMRAQVDRLIRLSGDLLFMARFDQKGTDAITTSQVDLHPLLASVIDQIAPLAEKKEITLTQKLVPDLLIQGDMDLLIRVFINLLDNAIKFTPEEGTVFILADQEPKCIRIQICDTGIGILPEDLPHLFTRFYRVAQDRTRQDNMTSGSGLGLAIAQEIVLAHGGTIMATSTLDHGTSMTVQLPALIKNHS